MTKEHTLRLEPSVLARGEGHHLAFLNNLATIKLSAGPSGSMSVVEFLAPRGFGPPQHRHNTEDEFFVVLDGELRFLTQDLEIVGGPESVAHLPMGIPHTFQVLTETARFINMTASSFSVPRFDAMVTVLGEPTESADMPPTGYIDPTRVAEVCAAHDIDIVGPPPAPLTEDGAR